jgi:hypothetical protein
LKKIKEKKERADTDTKGVVTGEEGEEWKAGNKCKWMMVIIIIISFSYKGNMKSVHVTIINLRDKQCFLHLLMTSTFAITNHQKILHV